MMEVVKVSMIKDDSNGRLVKCAKGAGGFLMSENFEPGSIDAESQLFAINSRLVRVVANEIPPRARINDIYFDIHFVFAGVNKYESLL